MANFINGELWGKASNVPWAVIFPDAGTQPRHPSQLYEALGEGSLPRVGDGVVTVLEVGSKRGSWSGLFFVIYGFVRTWLEVFREPDLGDPLWAGMSRGQWFSVGLMILGFGLWVWRKKRAGR